MPDNKRSRQRFKKSLLHKRGVKERLKELQSPKNKALARIRLHRLTNMTPTIPFSKKQSVLKDGKVLIRDIETNKANSLPKVKL